MRIRWVSAILRGFVLDTEVVSSRQQFETLSSVDWTVQDWGLVPYPEALDRQLALTEIVMADRAKAYLVFCTHPPVVTVGRRRVESDIFAWEGPLVEVSRGGRATYHGPNQLVIYPILNLEQDNLPFRACDIGQYIRLLEQIMVRALGEWGVVAAGKRNGELFDDQGHPLETTGIWIGERKIGSVGVAVRNWISYHGIALNLLDDPQAFQGINPCGFKSSIMTSVEKELGRAIPRGEILENIKQKFSQTFW